MAEFKQAIACLFAGGPNQQAALDYMNNLKQQPGFWKYALTEFSAPGADMQTQFWCVQALNEVSKTMSADERKLLREQLLPWLKQNIGSGAVEPPVLSKLALFLVTLVRLDYVRFYFFNFSIVFPSF